jgi:GNAT superfamily N-acetyltransferase
MDDHYVMRRMSRAEFDVVVEWAAAEGWNPGRGDADVFFATDPSGFFVGELDGELVASISIVTYDDGRAFLGFYIVRPDLRGKGYGLRLWDFARRRVDVTGTGLDGVMAQIESYRRSGFALAHWNTRFVSMTPPNPPEVAPAVRRLMGTDVEDLLRYDRDVFGCSRFEFVRGWVAQAQARTFVAIEEERLRGYGMLRPAVDGSRVGPLFADTPDLAGAVLDAMIASVQPGEKVSVDVPGNNPAALQMAAERSMTPEFETARMYAGEPPSMESTKVFGITSFELG